MTICTLPHLFLGAGCKIDQDQLVSYIDRLIENCQKAKSATPVREFVVNDLSELAGIKQAIYIIEQVD